MFMASCTAHVARASNSFTIDAGPQYVGFGRDMATFDWRRDSFQELQGPRDRRVQPHPVVGPRAPALGVAPFDDMPRREWQTR